MSTNPQACVAHDVSRLANELKVPPQRVFENDDFPALWFNLHDPAAMKSAFDSLPLDLLFPKEVADGSKPR